jgi:hypothetical protein
MAKGARFECEHLRTGQVSLTVSYHDEDIAIQVIPNDEHVLGAIDRLVRDAAERIGK